MMMMMTMMMLHKSKFKVCTNKYVQFTRHPLTYTLVQLPHRLIVCCSILS